LNGYLTHCFGKTAPLAHKKEGQKRVMIKDQLLLLLLLLLLHCYTPSQSFEEGRGRPLLLLLLLLQIHLERQVHQGCVKKKRRRRMALLTRTT